MKTVSMLWQCNAKRLDDINLSTQEDIREQLLEKLVSLQEGLDLLEGSTSKIVDKLTLNS